MDDDRDPTPQPSLGYCLGAFAGWVLLLIYVGIEISDWTDVIIRYASRP